VLPSQFLKWPTELQQDELAKMSDSMSKSKFSNVIGAVDGWAHAVGRAPWRLEDILFNKEKYNSTAMINLVICDLRGRILYVYSGVPGHCNDQMIANNIFQPLVGEPLINVKDDYSLLGDAIFHQFQIVTPYPTAALNGGMHQFKQYVRPNDTERKKRIEWNNDHSRHRIVVENVFARLQQTWKILKKGFNCDIHRYNKLVIVLCTLWNCLCDWGVQKFPRRAGSKSSSQMQL